MNPDKAAVVSAQNPGTASPLDGRQGEFVPCGRHPHKLQQWP
jgi:hypothetical protein